MACLVIIMGVGFTAITPVLAQDDEPIVGYRILGESQGGPHTIQLQVSPPAPILGISRFAVRVKDTATGKIIENAKIAVLASPAEHGEAQYTLALNSPVDPVYYLSQLKLETSGIWAVEVSAESDLGSGTTVMSVLVNDRARSGTGNVWGQALFILITLAFASGIFWLWYSSRKALRQRNQQK